jgi:RNA polymerase sigma factor (sigma-70 family)
MRKDWKLTKEVFDKFLYWLHPDPEEAGKKYEEIRRHLVIILNCRGCAEAEELADEAINRVIRRAQHIAGTYKGKPEYYFITVAHHLYLEYVAKHKVWSELPPELPQPSDSDPDEEREYDCLELCVQQLSLANRDLVIRYYQEDKQAMIDHRKKLADELGIAVNALRIRAHRIRATLQECIESCLASA